MSLTAFAHKCFFMPRHRRSLTQWSNSSLYLTNAYIKNKLIKLDLNEWHQLTHCAPYWNNTQWKNYMNRDRSIAFPLYWRHCTAYMAPNWTTLLLSITAMATNPAGHVCLSWWVIYNRIYSLHGNYICLVYALTGLLTTWNGGPGGSRIVGGSIFGCHGVYTITSWWTVDRYVYESQSRLT